MKCGGKWPFFTWVCAFSLDGHNNWTNHPTSSTHGGMQCMDAWKKWLSTKEVVDLGNTTPRHF